MRYLLTILLALWCSLCLGANVVWDGSESSNPADNDNWVGGAKPTASDVAVFSDQGDGNCTVAGDINWLGIQTTADYDGTIDLGDGLFIINIGASGVVLDHPGGFDMGYARLRITDGDWDATDCASVGAWTAGTGTVSLEGTTMQQLESGGKDIGSWTITKGSAGMVVIADSELELAAVTLVSDLDVDNSKITSTADPKSISGDVNFSEAGNDINLGAATWTITLSGGDAGDDFNFKSSGTWNAGTSTIVLGGEGDISGAASSHDLYNLTIPSSPSSADIRMIQNVLIGASGTFDLDGDLEIVSGKVFYAKGITTVGGSASITGAGTYRQYYAGSGVGLTTFTEGGLIDVATFDVYRGHVDSVLAGGTYTSASVEFTSNAAGATGVTLGSGAFIFLGDVTFENTGAGSNVIDVATNDPDLTFQGDITWNQAAGTLTYTKGDGTITASGTDATPDWDWGGATIEDIVVNKLAGALTFSGPWTADSFTATDGELNFGGVDQALATAGDFAIGPACTVVNTSLDDVDFAVGGNFSAVGTQAADLDFAATAAWTLDVTGGAHVRWCDFQNCAATAGSTVHAQRSVNSGSNTGFLWLLRPRTWATRRILPRRMLTRGVGAN